MKPSILFLLNGLALGKTCHDHRSSPSPLHDGEYDFIVAGGGTGGAIVASRLASADFHVLLVESGERLYDDAAVSAKFLMPVLTGADIDGVVDGVNPIIKTVGKLVNGKGAKDSAIYDAEGKKVGDFVEGVPGFMPHIQETPFMGLYMSMTDACHNYPTTPQVYAQKREIDYPRGNVLGGSSAANTMVYFRGSKRDFNQWHDELGLKGWGYDDVLPYFKKFEHNWDVNDPSVHGFSGPINITIGKNHAPSPASDEWTAAALRLGWPKLQDASNPETVYGASDSWQMFVGPNGKRSDSSAYIQILDKHGKVCWNKERKNCDTTHRLHVWTKTYVSKILFEQDRAVGVEYIKHADEHESHKSEHASKDFHTNEGVKHHTPYNKWDRLQTQKKNHRLGAPVAKELAYDWDHPELQYIPEKTADLSSDTKRVTAKYEVILSAGAVASAQILMLSGVGPADHLHERGIKVVADLPVGKRMQDHQEVIVTYKFPKTFVAPFDFTTETMKGFPTLRKHLAGERTFFSTNGVPAGLEGSSAGPTGQIPKWHMHHIIMGGFENFDWNIASYDETIKSPSRLPRSVLEFYTWKGLHYHSHNCELSQNHAYGRLELRNTDPFTPPFLDPRYGSSDEDNYEMADCIKAVRQLMKESDPQWVGEELEPSKSAVTQEALTQFVRNNVWGHHISGSTPMGNCSTWYAVADERARVHKVQGLRVADISLVPTLPHGNPAGVVMMMAEKIADMILHDYQRKSRAEL